MEDPFHTPLAGAIGEPYRLNRDGAPAPAEPLIGVDAADLAIIGAGYRGLWTAPLAKEQDPGRDVVVIEAGTAGWAVCSAGLTHGFDNGLSRFPDEMERLEQRGLRNLDENEKTIRRYGIDCDFERTGELNVATTDWQLPELTEYSGVCAGLGVRFHENSRVERLSSKKGRLRPHTWRGPLDRFGRGFDS